MHVCTNYLDKVKTLDYDRIDVSDGIDFIKTVGLRQCFFVITGTFLNKFYIPTKVCDCYHDMTEKVNDFVIAPATRDDYRMNIWFMNKSDAVCRMKNAALSKKKEQLWL